MDQQNLTLSPRGILRILSIIYFTFLGAQLLFGALAFLNQENTYFDYSNTNDVFIYAVPVFAVSSIVIGIVLFGQQTADLSYKSSLKEKLEGYQAAVLVRMAFLEAASIFGIIAFILKGNLFSLLISGLVILYFLTLRPGKVRAENDLNLSLDEKGEFEGRAGIDRP